MNTRLFNLTTSARTARTQGASEPKRRRTTQSHQHHRAPIEEEFDTVRWREETHNSRKRVVTATNDTWSNTNSWLPEDNTEFGLDEESAWLDEDGDGNVFIEIQPPLPASGGKNKRSVVSVSASFRLRSLYLTLSQTRPHLVWAQNYRDTYLDELLRWDGRGDFHSDGLASCPDCISYKVDTPGKADHRCVECYIPILTCKECCIRRHRMDPFHRIEVGNLNSVVSL